jgi:hypothetical protein
MLIEFADRRDKRQLQRESRNERMLILQKPRWNSTTEVAIPRWNSTTVSQKTSLELHPLRVAKNVA